jgi:SAM-dependent methyltransferase
VNTLPHRHYDASYFAWQRKHSGGPLSAAMDSWKFEPFLSTGDVLLDFGCGGGFLLQALPCRSRYGIEVNPAARDEASLNSKVYGDIEDLPEDVFFDVIVSHHALEHVDNPLDVLRKLYARLKKDGKLIFVVPSEEWHRQKYYQPDDVNQHLYTWTPLSLGNLLARAGFRIERTDLLRHRWPPKAQKIYGLVPPSIFHVLCQIWGAITRNREIRIVASRSTIE